MQHTAWKDFNTGRGRFLPCWSYKKNDKIMGPSNEAL